MYLQVFYVYYKHIRAVSSINNNIASFIARASNYDLTLIQLLLIGLQYYGKGRQRVIYRKLYRKHLLFII